MAQTENQAVEDFRTYLKEVYTKQPAPCITEWPLDTNNAFEYIELAIDLIERDGRKRVHLDEIFQCIPACNRGRAFLQGSAGSGKSTLVWRASKKWASGDSFTEFELFIALELNDPALQEAEILEDIVRSLDKDNRRGIAAYIKRCNGKKVAFLLDGWDQFQQCQHSYIIKLVKGEVLTSASVLITSRNNPISFPFHSPAFMVLLGFTKDQISRYLVSRPFTPVEFQTLIGLCSHPLNAAIVKYLYNLNGEKISQPIVTNTDLMMYLIHHCLLRHVHHEKDADIYHENLQQLMDMEEEIRFNRICKLAFDTIQKQKTLLTIRDLQAYNIHPENSTELLGLIRKKTIHFRDYYEFNHETIQELLAAFCIHKMYQQQNPQVHEYLNYVLETNPTSMVVPFCAGIFHTTFKDTLHTILNDFIFPPSIPRGFDAVSEQTHLSRCNRLLTIVKAIYEAQSPELCHVLAERVGKFPIHVVHQSPSLTFWQDIQDPLLYLHVGYFLVNISSLAMNICVDFGLNIFCTLSANLFAYPLLQQAEKKKTQLLKIDLNIGEEVEAGAVAVIAQLICKTSLISGLRLAWYRSETNSGHVLRSLIGSVLVSTSLKYLYFRGDLLTKQHVWYLILLLSCSKHLKLLSLRGNYDIGVSLLAIPLKHNDTLTHLMLSSCGIESSQLECLGESLKTNSTLEYLDVSYNPFSSDDLLNFLSTILNSRNPSLQVLKHSHRYTGGHRVTIEIIIGAINFNRAKSHLPELFLPHASLVTPSRDQMSKLYKTRPMVGSVDRMADIIGEADAPGSTLGEPPQILDVIENVGRMFSTGRSQGTTQSGGTTIAICEDDSGIHINTHSSSKNVMQIILDHTHK